MRKFRAAWVLPITEPPIRNGWVAVDRDRIVAFGRPAAESRTQIAEQNLGAVALLPGLVNAHTHLELSHMRDEVPPAPDFVSWIRDVVVARRRRPDARSDEIMRGVAAGIREAIDCGTVLVGDISNTLAAFEPLAASALGGVLFYELIRFSVSDPDGFVEQAQRQIDSLSSTERVRVSLAAHAPYSVAPLVLRAIRRAVDRNPFAPYTVHLSESAEEVEFIKSGSGPWRTFLEEIGSWEPAWVPPGRSPVEYLDDTGFLTPRLLAVHGVQMSTSDLARLASRGTTLVTCPRSNGHTGAGAPPLEDFYASGVRVAIGTDSLASAPDLNVFAELATMRALAPTLPASVLLESATIQGARALGFEADYGTIEAGKRARLIAVDVPDDVADVEEYLVGGIAPDQIRWLE